MIAQQPSLDDLNIETQGFYRRAVQLLNAANIPFLVGGAYALAHYTGIVRHTKDFDVFLTEEDCGRALDLFAAEGFRTELTHPHWLGKAFSSNDFVDFIYSSGNGVAKVDARWFDHALWATFLGEPVRLCPVEEMIWSKSFVCERERFDGADICHLIRARGREFDWGRLVERFGPYWRVLLAHLVLFGFVYPGERGAVPVEVMDELTRRLQEESRAQPPLHRICQGTLLSRIQYAVDLNEWCYKDARLDAVSGMTCEDVDQWTEAGLRDQGR